MASLLRPGHERFLRSADHRRWHQWRRYCARRRRARSQSRSWSNRSDLASATSSASTKLIHGGLRYLELFEFRLVREALIERERLLAHRTPHHSADAIRAAARRRVATALADSSRAVSLRSHRRSRRLPASRGVRLRPGQCGRTLHAGLDAWLRLLGLLGRRQPPGDAQRTRCCSTWRRDSHSHPLCRVRSAQDAWLAQFASKTPPRTSNRPCARAIVNAAGPWVEDVLHHVPGSRNDRTGAPGQRQSHRRAAAVRRRTRVPAAESRRPHRIHDSLSGRLHARGHDRRALRRRSAPQPQHLATTRSSTCARR